MIRMTALIGLIALINTAAFAQKKEGEKAFENRDWAKALELLNTHQAEKPGDIGVLTKIGICHYRLHQPEKARQFLEYVIQKDKDVAIETRYFFARTLHGMQEWNAAVEAYKQFLRSAPADHVLRANVRDNIRRCLGGIDAKSNDNVALIENLGAQINTEGDEFAPLPSPNHTDRLYFSAARQGASGGKRRDDGFEAPDDGHWCSDMYLAQRGPAGWKETRPLSALQNTSRFEMALDFSNDGRVLYFFRGFTLFSGEIYTDTSGLNDEYRSHPASWDGPLQPENSDEGLFFYHDSTVFFSSRRNGGSGGLDLWCGRRVNGQWVEPVWLGPELNTPYDETTPFLSRDGRTLFFSANHTGSIGGYDIYQSTYDPATEKWSHPQSLGLPVNSPGNDLYFRLNTDGRTAYLASDRLLDNLGESDIYQVYFKESIAAQTEKRNEFALFQQSPKSHTTPATGLPTVEFTPLYYSNERDLLSSDNRKQLDQAAAWTRAAPDLRLLITVHTDENSGAPFDLFNGIKRAETVGKALVERGVAPSQLILRSGGANFPMAVALSGADAAARLNRRVEIMPTQIEGQLPMKIKTLRPELSPEAAAAGAVRLEAQYQGLSYRVEMIVANSVLTTEALGLFTDVMIESIDGKYHYTAGCFRKYSETSATRRDLVAQGFTEASVTAYINGVRISRAEAVGYIRQYPDLAAFIKG